jgi:TolA-binding protein
MKRLVFMIPLLLVIVGLACSQASNFPFPARTPIPSASPTPTIAPPTATITPTPTPVPTPTPLPVVRITNGERARFEGSWELALEEYQNALASSTNPDIQSAALLGIARTQIAAGDYQAGVDTLDQLIASFPQSPEMPYAYFSLGQAYTALGLYAESAQAEDWLRATFSLSLIHI